jgi:hypothetical protein
VQTLFRDRNPKIEMGGAWWSRGRIENKRNGTRVQIGRRGSGEQEAGKGMGGYGTDLVENLGRTAAHELGVAVDDHLRGVHTAIGDSRGVVFLAPGEIGGGERVGPAEMVPVVHVLFESEDFDAVKGLLFAESFQK